MDENFELVKLITQKQVIEKELGDLVYGSPEIRSQGEKKYIYVHKREDGIQTTNYVGEYSDDLYNLIVKNSIKAKDLKKQLKEVNKGLKSLGYVEGTLSDIVEKNIDFAKRNLVLTIYKQAILEGVATTFADTESILEGGKINNMSVDDVRKIINLKHAWEFVLNRDIISSKTNYYLLCEINKLVGDELYYSAGKIRSVPVSIGGTKWTPSFPIESVVKEELEEIFSKKKGDVDKAIDLLLYIMKKQIFIDGNKRTAIIFINHFLISKGKGIIVIPDDFVEEFKKLLINYYEGKDEKQIRKFIKEKCYLNVSPSA